MSTRSGTNYKPIMSTGDTHAEDTRAEHSPMPGVLPEMSNLTDMVRTMIEDRERREKEFAQERERRDREMAEERERMERKREEERRRYEEANERQMQEMHKQMELLQRLVAERTLPQRDRESRVRPSS